MPLNMEQIQQQLDMLLHDHSEQHRRYYEMFYDPEPRDVVMQIFIDGQLQDVTLPNRARLVQWFGKSPGIQPRNSVLFGKTDLGTGAASYLIGSGNQVELDATPVMLLLAFAAGWDAQGPVDHVAAVTEDLVWDGLPVSSEVHLYLERDPGTGGLSHGLTTVAPLTAAVAPAAPAPGQHWYDTTAQVMRLRDNGAWVVVQRVFVGQVVTDAAGQVTVVTPAGLCNQVQAEAAPTITSPAAGASDVSLQPVISCSSYPVAGDAHLYTQYQIARDEGFTELVYDSGDSSDLTTHVVPRGLLEGLTTYHVRVRHKGGGGYGPWSSPRSITTVSATIIGVALLAAGGNGGTWTHIDAGGNAITPTAGYFGGHAVWGNIKDVTIDGQAMVQIPRFYIKRATLTSGGAAGKEAWWVSDAPAPGYEVHPAFRAGGVDLDQIYVGKYQASSDGTKMQSVPGVSPAVSKSLVTCQAEANARNTGGVTGFGLWSVYHWSAIQWLYLVEYATMDSQARTGSGRVSAASVANVDASDVAVASYRGIVGLWGNIWQWLDGLKTAGGAIHLWDRNGNKSWINTGQRRAAGAGAIYPLTFMGQVGSQYRFADIFLGDTGRTQLFDATAPDYQWFSEDNEYYPYVGGDWTHGNQAGLWDIACNAAAASVGSSRGARLAKV